MTVTEAQSPLPVVSYLSVPLVASGRLVITTLCSVSSSSMSLKLKFSVFKMRSVFCGPVTELLKDVGASFVASTLILSVLEEPVFVV